MGLSMRLLSTRLAVSYLQWSTTVSMTQARASYPSVQKRKWGTGARAVFPEEVAFKPAFPDWVRQSRGERGLGGGNSLNKGSEVALQKTPVQSAWGRKGEQDGVRAGTGC